MPTGYALGPIKRAFVIGSFPAASMGPIYRDIPEVPTDETVTGDVGNDTIT